MPWRATAVSSAPLARVHAAHRTPGVSILALSVWGASLVLSGRYDQLLTYVIFASWILYGMAAASVLVLRRKRPDLERPYRTIGYPVVPVLFVTNGRCFGNFYAVQLSARIVAGTGVDFSWDYPFIFIGKEHRRFEPSSDLHPLFRGSIQILF